MGQQSLSQVKTGEVAERTPTGGHRHVEQQIASDELIRAMNAMSKKPGRRPRRRRRRRPQTGEPAGKTGKHARQPDQNGSPLTERGTTMRQASPPMAPSNEATKEQLDVARTQGDAYHQAMQAMAEEEGAHTAQAGDYLIGFVNEEAEGMYALEGDSLVWREAAEDANVHLEVAVADAADGRFVPGLAVHLALSRDGDPVLATDLPFLWHPFLHHYGTNARVPGEGPYRVTVRVAPAAFMRHDPVNGLRYAQPVEVHFDNITLTNGRKTSPDAHPRGPAAPTAAGA